VSSRQSAVVTFTDAASFGRHGRSEEGERIRRAACYRSGRTDAHADLLVAIGRTEIALEPIMETWDRAPFPLMMQEPGGHIGDWRSNVTVYGREGLATDKVLLPQVLASTPGRWAKTHLRQARSKRPFHAASWNGRW